MRVRTKHSQWALKVEAARAIDLWLACEQTYLPSATDHLAQASQRLSSIALHNQMEQANLLNASSAGERRDARREFADAAAAEQRAVNDLRDIKATSSHAFLIAWNALSPAFS